MAKKFDYPAIKAELEAKFSGPVYTASARMYEYELNGTSYWQIEFNLNSDGSRAAEYDGKIKRLDNGITTVTGE